MHLFKMHYTLEVMCPFKINFCKMFPLSGIVHQFFSFLFFLSVLVACHRAPLSVPDDEVLGNQSDTNTDKTSDTNTDRTSDTNTDRTRALAQGCRYLDVFWPASQVPLEESAWVDSCTTKIIEELGADKFVIGVENNPSATCIVCSKKGACIRPICSCTTNDGAESMLCHKCLFENLATSNLSCPNSSGCEKLLPHEIIRRAKGGAYLKV